LPADGGAIPDPTKGGDDNNQLKYGVIAGVCVLVAVIIVAGVLAVRRHRKRNRFRDTSIETVLAAHRTLAEKRATKALPLGDNFGTSYASYGSGANTSIAKFTAIQNNSNNSSRVPSMMVRQSAVSGMEFLPPLTPFCISPERNDLQQGRRSGYQSPIPSIYGSPSPQRTALQSNQRMEPASLGQNVGGSFPASGGGQWLRNQQHRASSAYYTRNRPESGYLYYR
jgi:hypothetical protein